MQISIGKQGTKLKLTKRERDTLGSAFQILLGIAKHGGGDLAQNAHQAAGMLDDLSNAIAETEPTVAPTVTK